MFIQEFFTLLRDPLTFLNNFIAENGILTYGLVFLIVFAETGLVVFPLLPGDSLLFSLGLLAANGDDLQISKIIPLLIIAAILGDQVNYFSGKIFGSMVLKREKIFLLKKEHIIQTQAFYEKYGKNTIILARFVPIVRTVAPFVAGTGKMKYGIYLAFGIIGATIWVSSITSLGYFLGNNEWVNKNFEKVVLLIVFISILPIIIGFIKSKLKAK